MLLSGPVAISAMIATIMSAHDERLKILHEFSTHSCELRN